MNRYFILLFLCFGKIISQNNIDFESTAPGVYTTANAVSGWTISSASATNNCTSANTWTPGSSELAILTTPIITNSIIGIINHSPLGGANIAQLNNTVSNSSCTKLAKTLTVTALHNSFQFAFATVLESGHACCHQPSLAFLLKDEQNSILSCNSLMLPTPGDACQTAVSGFSFSPTGGYWTNWQIKTMDLSAFTGSILTIEVIATDCTAGDHYGTLYFDCRLTNLYAPVSTTLSSAPNPINYCAGSPTATIISPIGYSNHQWYYLPAPGFTLPIGSQPNLTLNNVGVGFVYKLNVISFGGCPTSFFYTITPTPVNIDAIISSPSCSLGTSGSATVFVSGGGSYNYSWTSATNVVSTTSVVNGLAPGNYTVSVSAGINSSCGTASAVVNIGIKPQSAIKVAKPFCNNSVVLNASGGSNLQWYSGTVAIPSGQGGNATSYVVSSASTGAIYYLSSLSNQGCTDSLEFTLVQIPSGSINISNPLVCPGSSNGSINISLIPSLNSPWGLNSYSVFSTGTFTPAYSNSVSPTHLNSITFSGLSTGVTYSILASDGQCSYTRSFVTMPLYNYSISPSSPTVCSGVMLTASVVLTNPLLTSYSYSWSPNTFIFGNPGQSAIITPSIQQGFNTTLIYSVTVSPNSFNCPITKTVGITVVNLATPTIAPIPALCNNDPIYTVTAYPAGGMFYNNPGITQAGVLSPQLANPGLNTLTYLNSFGSCTSQTTASFYINTINLSASASSSIYCGQSKTLTATGADNYTWSNGGTGSSTLVSPVSTTTYSVIGTTTNSCSQTQTIQVSVTSSLVVSISGTQTLCIGNTGSLSASGANTYTWYSGSVSPSILISPTIPTTYSVIGSDLFGCKNSAQIQVFVYSKPIISVAGNLTVCPGRETTLHAYNVYWLEWSTGAIGNTITVSPPVTTVYTVTGTDFYGCKSVKTITVFVDCVGTDEFTTAGSIKIYPNPTKEKLFIESPSEFNLILIDELGKILLEKKFSAGNNTIDLEDYTSGFYFLKLSKKNSFKVFKFIKTD